MSQEAVSAGSIQNQGQLVEKFSRMKIIAVVVRSFCCKKLKMISMERTIPALDPDPDPSIIKQI